MVADIRNVRLYLNRRFLARICQEAINILRAKAAVTPGTYAVGFQNTLVTPAPHCVNVHIENAGNLTGCQHWFSLIYHKALPFFSYLYLTSEHYTLFNLLHQSPESTTWTRN